MITALHILAILSGVYAFYLIKTCPRHYLIGKIQPIMYKHLSENSYRYPLLVNSVLVTILLFVSDIGMGILFYEDAGPLFTVLYLTTPLLLTLLTVRNIIGIRRYRRTLGP